MCIYIDYSEKISYIHYCLAFLLFSSEIQEYKIIFFSYSIKKVKISHVKI